MNGKPRQAYGIEVNLAKGGFEAQVNRADQVHFLNNTAYAVFELCNGERSVEEIAAFMQNALKLDSPPLEDVQSTIREFAQKGLIKLSL